MSAAVVGLIVVALAAACSTVPATEEPSATSTIEPATTAPAEDAPPRVCHDINIELDPEEPGYASPEEAADAFVQSRTDPDSSVAGAGSLRGAEAVNGRIMVDGKEIGTIQVGSAPAGGFEVTYASWCPAK